MIEINRLSQRKLDVSELQIGMYVSEVDRPWKETPFLFQGFPLLTLEDIRAVQDCCQYVYIDELRRVSIKLDRAPGLLPGQPPASRRAPLSAEMQKARASHRKTGVLVKDMFFDIQLGKGIDTGACRTVVRDNLESMLRNESALLWLSRMKSQDEYTSQHCLAVSVMAMGFGRHLGIEREGLEQLGLAGLLHDVGKIRIDPQILNKPGKLSDEEFAHMKTHASLGFKLLVSHRDLPPIVVDVAHGHHERLDGTGYPRQLNATQIARFTRIISIIDCFDAITSNRVYDRARTVKQAFKVLMDLRNCQFDAELVMRFIEWLGIFPVGTLVELHTGEVGLVVEKHPRLQLRPKVVVLINQEGQRCPPRFLDLSKVCVDQESNPYRITACLPDGALGLSMSDPEVQALLDNRELEGLDDECEVPELVAHWGRPESPA